MNNKKEEEKELQLREIEVFEKVSRSFLFLTSALAVGFVYLFHIYDTLSIEKDKGHAYTLVKRVLNNLNIKEDINIVTEKILLFTFLLFFTSMVFTYGYYVLLIGKVSSYKTCFSKRTKKGNALYIIKVLSILILYPIIIFIFFIFLLKNI